MIHGGDIYHETIAYDFSVNTNPTPCPKQVLLAAQNACERLHCYPEYQSLTLRRQLADYLALKAEEVLVGNGASELFLAIVRAIMPQKALLLAPSFYGYEHALKSVDCQIERYYLKEEEGFLLGEDFLDALHSDLNLIILANPNNPTGKCISPDLLHRILNKCEEEDIFLLLDSCFWPLSDAYLNSSCSRRPLHPKLVEVFAFTKLFSVPGARIGYLTCEEELAKKIQKQLPEWNLSVLADAIGRACLDHLYTNDYVEESILYLSGERRRMMDGLEGISGLISKVYDSDSNFFLLRSTLPLKKMLLEQGILIRDCSNFAGLNEGYYRIAVKDAASNDILLHRLQEMEERMNSWN